MGDEVVSLRSLFLRTWTLSSEKLKAVVTSVKNFRWIMPWAPERFPRRPPMANSSQHNHIILLLVLTCMRRENTKISLETTIFSHCLGVPNAVCVFVTSIPFLSDSFIVGKDIWPWIMFGSIPLCSIIMGILILMGDPSVNEWLAILDMILMILGLLTHLSLLTSIFYWYRDMPFRLIGAKAKFKLEVIPMIIAAAFHHLLEFNYGYFLLILGFTTYFYIIAHFMRAAYDIGGKDVLLGLVMLVLAYFLKGGLLVRGLGLSLCVVLCFYRYVTYSAPEVPVHVLTHMALLTSILYWYRDMPIRLIGAKAKFKLEVIPMIIAAAFHHLLEFNYGYFCLILGITTYFYTIAHFMRAVYDIGGKDVLLGLVMLVLAYFLKGGLLVRGLGLSLCVVLCFYRYVTRASMGDEVVLFSVVGLSLHMDAEVVTSAGDEFVSVVTSVKNFRWIMPWDPRRFRGGGLIVGMDMSLWYMFGSIPPISIIIGIMILLGDPTVNKWLLIPDMILMLLGGMVTHPALLASIIYWYRDMPFRLIGAKAKFKLEVIPMIIAAAFHHLLEFNYGYFCLILGITTYFYTIAHFMRVAYDIGGKDVLLGLVMLVLAYFLKGGLYVTYSAPEDLENKRAQVTYERRKQLAKRC
ncbi:hypothetical protein H5410_048766 [Solanum commersonii]|uniref:Uncharacterized protein n=1 Tax=Solanum commersonii TaxID=4109 RepID=A0A9J5XLZ6_SOLCO|nr:hypothetical protein H5410_048766 [Solanum commersonii]